MKVILNKLNTIKFKVFESWLWLNNLFSFRNGASGSSSRDIVISLTTYPKRLKKVYLTVESLMNQSLKPDTIVLWLSKSEISENDIPKSIKRLESRGLEVRFVDENIRSYKKLIYSLDCFDDATLITCDDDVIYPRNFLIDLVAKSREFPGCIAAYRCSEIISLQDGSVASYLNWPNARGNGPSFQLFPTGVGGVLYPPRSLSYEVFNKEVFLRLAPMADDIWFKAMSLLNCVPVVMVKEKSIEFPTISGSQKTALWHENNLKGRNDEQFQKVFDFYNLYDRLK